MRMHLEVTSKDRYYLGDAARYTFDVRGGAIGRSGAANWMIEDINSFISSTHLQVKCRDGGFYITDVSTNGTFRGHQRLQKNTEDPTPLRQGEELRLGDVKIIVLAIDSQHTDRTEGPVSSQEPVSSQDPAASPKREVASHDDSLAEHEVLAQQARLADVISQCYPDVDHGHSFRENLGDELSQSEGASLGVAQESELSNQASNPDDAVRVEYSEFQPEKNDVIASDTDISALLDLVIKQLLVETQRHLAVDRIENPDDYASMSQHNVFRLASSLPEFYRLMVSHESVRVDLIEVLKYLEHRKRSQS